MKKIMIFCAAMLLCGNAFAEQCDQSKLSSVSLYYDETAYPPQVGGTVVYDGVTYYSSDHSLEISDRAIPLPHNIPESDPLKDPSKIDAKELIIDRMPRQYGVCSGDPVEPCRLPPVCSPDRDREGRCELFGIGSCVVPK